MHFVQDKERYKDRIRKLWQEAFQEEEAYLQYYFEQRFLDTKMYMYVSDTDELLSMIHVNPLRMRVKHKSISIPYIVGVATKTAYQRKGLMARLMHKVLLDCRTKAAPFVLLKTEHEEYYKGFGFHTIHQQRYYSMKRLEAANCQTRKVQPDNVESAIHGKCWIWHLQETDIAELASWANRYLASQYEIYVEHNGSYMQRMQKEYQSQQGDILVIGREERIGGYVCYGWSQDELVIQEFMCEEPRNVVFCLLQDYIEDKTGVQLAEAVEQKMPVTMAYMLEDENCGGEQSGQMELAKTYAFSKMLLTDWV